MTATKESISSASATRTPATEPMPVHQQKGDKKESLCPIPIQPKLSVGSSDDPLEKEADEMADQVMRKPNPEPIRFSAAKNIISRKCAECEKEEQLQRKENNSEISFPVADRLDFSASKSSISRKCAECEKEEELQRKESQSDSTSHAPSIVDNVLSSPGRSLDADTRSFMESRFDHDFTNVKIHDNDIAAKSADSINALAYTSGNNIVFNSGQYNANTDSGKRLLAHELSHVVQQNGSNLQRKEEATSGTAPSVRTQPSR